MLIIDGLMLRDCFISTVISTLNKKFNVYAVMNGTNCHEEELYKFTSEFNSYYSRYLKIGNLVLTTTDEVLCSLHQFAALPKVALG